ncbi:YbbR domain-containing protein [Anaerosporobacter mobilis DSM 15930]|jgi:YbbR domain-containing protein|uniref:YbbR domain-containing protein n=1 Tax=Anaerosporobacter mobilis DSM 15930 TaxID=1120996 RepID=A0A1M7L6Q6_9FIRM|nr:CdaR family protein [Anaerosporobacter mobilis]SHM73031.1 YbbR domain-containing protein [Anaerosporobacter mobilis DSM 15930]
MKRKWTKNLGLKILSLGLAALIWFIIVNIDDPAISRTFRLSVEKRNEDVIASQGMCYEVLEGDAVTITVKGKRSVVEALTTSDFSAYADLSKLSRWNAVPIKVELTKYLTESDTPSITIGSVDTLIVSLEETETKQFKVSVVKKGTVEEGYCIGELKTKPNIIQVTGAKSQISKIDEVKVEIDVSNASENFTTSGVPKVYDADGKEINSSKMTFSTTEVKVVGTLLNTKTIPVDIEIQGNPLHGYRYISTEYEPKSVTIAGDRKALSTVSKIVIPIDISGQYEDIETEINLENYLPDGVILEEESLSVMVNIVIEKLQIKDFTFDTKDIQFKDLNDQLKFNYINDTTSTELVIKIMGREEDLKNLKISDLNPYIDLKGKNKPGSYVIEVQFATIEGIVILNKPTVSIELTAETDNETEDGNQGGSSDTKPDIDVDNNNGTNDNNTETSGGTDTNEEEDNKEVSNAEDNE